MRAKEQGGVSGWEIIKTRHRCWKPGSWDITWGWWVIWNLIRYGGWGFCVNQLDQIPATAGRCRPTEDTKTDFGCAGLEEPDYGLVKQSVCVGFHVCVFFQPCPPLVPFPQPVPCSAPSSPWNKQNRKESRFLSLKLQPVQLMAWETVPPPSGS